MDYVYDASFAGTSVIPDEVNPMVEKLKKTIGEEDNIYVPNLFWFEITSIFKNLIRRKRYTFDEVNNFFPLLSAYRFTTDINSNVSYSQKLLRLSNEYNLTPYDAAYLELADRKQAVLCTFDADLISAAKKHGLKTFGEV